VNGKRSTRVLTLGIAVFVAGTALTFVGLRSGSAKTKAPAKQSVAAKTAVTAPTANNAAAAPAVSPLTVLPDGMEAVAVQLPYVPGVAGYVQPNDLINVYATVKNGPSNAKLKQPIAKLVLSKVRVIDVKAPAPGAETNTTFLLALSAKNAEQVIFLARYESLWFTLVKPNAKPAKTTGRGYDNLL